MLDYIQLDVDVPEFALMSEYDAYTTLILSKKDHVRSLIQKYGWETVVCDHETTPAWFLD